ncbi:MAG: septal ring lytic transglycosylase RlpA family protein [Nitrospirae bacterium]|nr:septal ring lytic transglycosylase RlpA family protein [Nitrospirota bacterium]
MFRWLLGFFLVILTASCASVPRPGGDYSVGYRETGVASWYGEDFHGRPTANGEIYDMYGLTAAHRLMPLGTIVKVTHRENGRSVTVKVNDRGPFVHGRILDLSYGAAKTLGMTSTGTAPVAIEVVGLPKNFKAAAGRFSVQVGAFEVEENAKHLAERLRNKYADVYLVTLRTNQNTIYRVRVGLLGQERLALKLAERLSGEDRLDTFVTRKDP